MTVQLYQSVVNTAIYVFQSGPARILKFFGNVASSIFQIGPVKLLINTVGFVGTAIYNYDQTAKLMLVTSALVVAAVNYDKIRDQEFHSYAKKRVMRFIRWITGRDSQHHVKKICDNETYVYNNTPKQLQVKRKDLKIKDLNLKRANNQLIEWKNEDDLDDKKEDLKECQENIKHLQKDIDHMNKAINEAEEEDEDFNNDYENNLAQLEEYITQSKQLEKDIKEVKRRDPVKYTKAFVDVSQPNFGYDGVEFKLFIYHRYPKEMPKIIDYVVNFNSKYQAYNEMSLLYKKYRKENFYTIFYPTTRYSCRKVKNYDVRLNLHSHGPIKFVDPELTKYVVVQVSLKGKINERKIIVSQTLVNNYYTCRLTSKYLPKEKIIPVVTTAVGNSSFINIPRSLAIKGRNVYDDTIELLKHLYYYNFEEQAEQGFEDFRTLGQI